MQQNPCLELNNGGSSRVPCEQQNILAALSFLHFVCSALQNACTNAAASLCSSSFLKSCNISSFSILVTAHLHITTNSTFLKQYQPSSNRKAGNQHPCNNANYMLLIYMKWAWNK
ncbi:hypothetical protein GQ457_17G007960 [Hibiscus cannabinus]